MKFNPFFPPEADLTELDFKIQAFEANFFMEDEIESLNGKFMDLHGFLIAFDKKGFVIIENNQGNLDKLKKCRFKRLDSQDKVDDLKLNYITNKQIFLDDVLDSIKQIPDLEYQLKRTCLDQETVDQILDKLLYYKKFNELKEILEYAIENKELWSFFEYMFFLREALSENWKSYAQSVFSKGGGVLKDRNLHLLQEQILEFALDFKEPKPEINEIKAKVESRIKESLTTESGTVVNFAGEQENKFSAKEPEEYDYLGGTIFEDWMGGILISSIAIPLGGSYRSVDFKIDFTGLVPQTTFYVEKSIKELNVPFGSKLNEYQLTESGVVYSFSMLEFGSLIEYEKRTLEKLRKDSMTNDELDFVKDLLPEQLPPELTNLEGKDINLVISKLTDFLGQCTYNNSELVELNENPNSIFEFVLKNKLGNCLAYSQLIAAILNTNGFETYLATTNNSYDSEKGFSSVGHAVLLIVNPNNGRIIEFDATKYLKKSRVERFKPKIKSREDEIKFNQRSVENQRFFHNWLDYNGLDVSLIDFEELKGTIAAKKDAPESGFDFGAADEMEEEILGGDFNYDIGITRSKLSVVLSSINVEGRVSNDLTLRKFLNEVVRNRNNYEYLISDADFAIFKSFLDEEVKLDITHIQNKELQFKLKLLGIDSNITIFDLFEFYFALKDETDRNQILNSQLINACFTLIYYSIDNYMEIVDSLEIDSGQFRSPDFNSLLDDDLESLTAQIIKERFSEELVNKFRELKKQKESPKIIEKLNETRSIHEDPERKVNFPKYKLAFEEEIAFRIFEGISKQLVRLRRGTQSPEWDGVREYQTGDDVRIINQKVTARRDKHHVNVYRNTEVNTPDRSILIVPFCTEIKALVDMEAMTYKLKDLAIKEKVTIKVYNAVDQSVHSFSPIDLINDEYGLIRYELWRVLSMLNVDGQVPFLPNVDCMETIYLNAQPGSMYRKAFQSLAGLHRKRETKCKKFRVIDAKLK